MSTTAMEPARISTGVSGLDHILRGGLPRGRLYLVDGSPGSGKTTLALQYLLAGVQEGESALYITLAETANELKAVAESHGWSLAAIQVYELPATHEQNRQRGQYTLFHPSDVELAGTIDAIISQVESVRPSRVVLDSLSELRLIAQDPLRYRRQVLWLKQYFAELGCTVLMLDDLTDVGTNHLQSIAHGVIRLGRVTMPYGPHRRRLEVIKLREVAFRGGFHDFEIRTGGLEVFPRLVAAEHHENFLQDQASSGIPALDQLLGGGVHRGSSSVVVGPAGAGKTTLTTQYALAAAQRGEHAAIYIFDEGLQTFYTRAAGLGMDIESQVKAGRIQVKQIDPAEMSPGEFAARVRQAVETEGARVVVIDSLNGYLNSMPDERYLILQIHELLMYLNQQGVVSMMVIAQRGLSDAAATIPFSLDLSYLVDTVIPLKYFEHEGEVNRSISVFKKRPGSHEHGARELRLCPEGLRVGEPMKNLRGVLSRTPEIVEEWTRSRVPSERHLGDGHHFGDGHA